MVFRPLLDDALEEIIVQCRVLDRTGEHPAGHCGRGGALLGSRRGCGTCECRDIACRQSGVGLRQQSSRHLLTLAVDLHGQTMLGDTGLLLPACSAHWTQVHRTAPAVRAYHGCCQCWRVTGTIHNDDFYFWV